ncbi:hypothetical protein [Streptomyces sp. NPDC057002]|uniref:hypothetical protein n=1 Tax=Streptomyces sp. NPDC057002 TaxID=3345992 RepID=UPI0036320676
MTLHPIRSAVRQLTALAIAYGTALAAQDTPLTIVVCSGSARCTCASDAAAGV